FPSRHLLKPGPLLTPDGYEEYTVDRIVDEKRSRKSVKYLVRWVGYGQEDDTWLPAAEL
ncbi:uncharacterized protein SCHCODRAFT_02446797, partial [Schizophyllum commune H4-8]